MIKGRSTGEKCTMSEEVNAGKDQLGCKLTRVRTATMHKVEQEYQFMAITIQYKVAFGRVVIGKCVTHGVIDHGNKGIFDSWLYMQDVLYTNTPKVLHGFFAGPWVRGE